MADQAGDAHVLELHDRARRADADAVRLTAAGAVDVEALDVDDAAVHLAGLVRQLDVANADAGVRGDRRCTADDDDVAATAHVQLAHPPHRPGT